MEKRIGIALLGLLVVTPVPAWAMPLPPAVQSGSGACSDSGNPLQGLLQHLQDAANAVNNAEQTAGADVTDFVGLHVLLSPDELQTIHRAHPLLVQVNMQDEAKCALYSLSGVMDYWHGKNPKLADPPMNSPQAFGAGVGELLFQTIEPLPGVGTWVGSWSGMDHYGRGKGSLTGSAFAVGGMTSTLVGITFPGLAKVAQSYGYKTRLSGNASLSDLKQALAAGDPPIVGFNVDFRGNPEQGTPDHAAVITGFYTAPDGTQYLIAGNSWSPDSMPYVWKVSDFMKSWDHSLLVVTP